MAVGLGVALTVGVGVALGETLGLAITVAGAVGVGAQVGSPFGATAALEPEADAGSLRVTRWEVDVALNSEVVGLSAESTAMMGADSNTAAAIPGTRALRRSQRRRGAVGGKARGGHSPNASTLSDRRQGWCVGVSAPGLSGAPVTPTWPTPSSKAWRSGPP